jgi:hypothetical protein
MSSARLVEVGEALIERWCGLGGDDCEVHDHGPFIDGSGEAIGYEDGRGEVTITPTDGQWRADVFDGVANRTVELRFSWVDVDSQKLGAPLLLSLVEELLEA